MPNFLITAMKIKKINCHTLIENILPDIVVERTLNKLPFDLYQLYCEKKAQGIEVRVGLDIQLGFYLILYHPTYQVELLWCENQKDNMAVALAPAH